MAVNAAKLYHLIVIRSKHTLSVVSSFHCSDDIFADGSHRTTKTQTVSVVLMASNVTQMLYLYGSNQESSLPWHTSNHTIIKYILPDSGQVPLWTYYCHLNSQSSISLVNVH